MIPAELLKQIRRIEITTNRIVNETMAGRYSSVFKGHGIEFEEVREYQPGDDIRSIDWNVTAKIGRPFIKRFREERELTVMLLIDLSRSMVFGSVRTMKHRAATELAALLAFSAIKNQDKVGLILFTDHIEHVLPPKKGTRHVLRLIRDVLSYRPTRTGTDLTAALRYVNRVTHRKTVTFVLSDFFCGLSETELAITNRKHDLIAVHLYDPREREIPSLGWLQLEDAETGHPVVFDSGKNDIRVHYRAWFEQHQARVLRTLQRAKIDRVELRIDQPYLEPFMKFFAMRAARR